VRWRKKTLDEMTGRLAQLGLSQCSVCGTGTRSILRFPVVLSIGGVYHEDQQRAEPDMNLLFMVQVTCSICGHAMLFDSGMFSGEGEQAMVRGMTEEEEAALEAESGT